jgi:hypothetical protein
MLLHAPALFQQQTLNIMLHRFRHRNMSHNKIQSRKQPPPPPPLELCINLDYYLCVRNQEPFSCKFYTLLLSTFTITGTPEQISALLGIDGLHYKLLHAFLTYPVLQIKLRLKCINFLWEGGSLWTHKKFYDIKCRPHRINLIFLHDAHLTNLQELQF